MNDPEIKSAIDAFESGDFPQAARLLEPLANAGVAEAQFRMALICQNGLGTEVAPGKAFEWMRTAAEQEHAMAQHGLGFMYLHGECADKDGTLAVEWLSKAAEQGLQGARTTLGLMYRQGLGVAADEEKSRYWYQQAGFDDV